MLLLLPAFVAIGGMEELRVALTASGPLATDWFGGRNGVVALAFAAGVFGIGLYYMAIGLAMMAVSGVELALWDLLGKALNQPIYNLLGGRCHEKVRAYANGVDGDTIAAGGL